MATKSVTEEVGDVESFRRYELTFHKEIEIILPSSHNCWSFLNGYHAYKKNWIKFCKRNSDLWMQSINLE